MPIDPKPVDIVPAAQADVEKLATQDFSVGNVRVLGRQTVARIMGDDFAVNHDFNAKSTRIIATRRLVEIDADTEEPTAPLDSFPSKTIAIGAYELSADQVKCLQEISDLIQTRVLDE